MHKKSAGILFYRPGDAALKILLVHPGGPFWTNRDEGAWSIPKGEFDESENALLAARREVKEELGIDVSGTFIELGTAKQKSGKIIYCWAIEHDVDASKIKSNTFELEWPPKSGKKQNFPEVDRAAWFAQNDAEKKIVSGQKPFIERLIAFLDPKAHGQR
ncbi:MAG: NUDIX domain-containing protein [Bacteroidetes bacterium]|nr:NUDIX domain-containing protein [Bacteroidota bacterium]